MNRYGIALLLVIGLFFLYVGLAWQGIIFLILAIIAAAYDWTKKESKKVWKEFSGAKTKDITPNIKGYFDNATKLTAEALTRKEKTKYQLTSPTKIQKGSKNFFDELKKIFK